MTCTSWKECTNKEPRHCALSGCVKEGSKFFASIKVSLWIKIYVRLCLIWIKFKTLVINIMENSNYIEYDNTNDQWNNGHIHVYKDGVLIESFFVDDLADQIEDFDRYDFIEGLKKTHKIDKVIEKYSNWR
jgi:hypothetical protein